MQLQIILMQYGFCFNTVVRENKWSPNPKRWSDRTLAVSRYYLRYPAARPPHIWGLRKVRVWKYWVCPYIHIFPTVGLKFEMETFQLHDFGCFLERPEGVGDGPIRFDSAPVKSCLGHCVIYGQSLTVLELFRELIFVPIRLSSLPMTRMRLKLSLYRSHCFIIKR